jgi:holdfast attachment protein HfaA
VSARIATIASIITAAAVLSLPNAASAQSLSGSSASFNGGYGRVNGQENHGVDFSLRDSNGNLAAVNGILQPAGANVSSQSSGSGSASASASAGAFAGGVGASAQATAIGNNLTVVTQGNYNTVIVDSVQINNGNVSASSSAGRGQ